MNVLDLFSGIGGFSLGLERAGMRTVAFCEIEPYPCAVLRKHWPNVPIYNDVRNLTAKQLEADGIPPIDVICGGFPCQPFSHAGKQLGAEDHRALWPEYRRLIEELRPYIVIGENVVGIIDMGLDNVLADLENLGYSARTFDIPACAAGAKHERRREWIIAYSSRDGCEGRKVYRCVDSLREMGQERLPELLPSPFRELHTGPGIHRKSDGIPKRVDRIAALGNAVVPQIPEIIGRAIMQAEKERGK